MRKILVTGGTVFVSRYVSEYFADKGDAVYVLNRNHRPQPRGCTLIEADRHQLGDQLRRRVFDAVLDVTAYTGKDVSDLLDALENVQDYVLISSSACTLRLRRSRLQRASRQAQINTGEPTGQTRSRRKQNC